MIKVRNLYVQYDKRHVLKDVSLDIKEKAITTIIGPNGCGKSTLLKTIGKNLSYKQGIVTIQGEGLHKFAPKRLAKLLAILPQNPRVPVDYTVHELVSLGRYPFLGFGKSMRTRDYEVIQWALRRTHMTSMETRLVSTLSGGERQRAWIAMALAQEPKILLLDEPTTYLDIAHQYEILELIREIQEKTKMTIAMVLHDINHAARYSDYIVVMKAGKVIKYGTPAGVINGETMKEVFNLKVKFVKDSAYPHFIPLERRVY